MVVVSIKRVLILVLYHIIDIYLLLLLVHVARNICVHITISNGLSSICTKTARLNIIIIKMIPVVFIAEVPGV